MPIIKEPLIVKCFNCKREIVVKFVPARKEYSQKNRWGYWTEAEEYKETYICDNCLLGLYKRKWEVRRLITNEKKRRLLAKYIKDGTITRQEKASFLLDINNNSCDKCKHTERERERESKIGRKSLKIKTIASIRKKKPKKIIKKDSE